MPLHVYVPPYAYGVPRLLVCFYRPTASRQPDGPLETWDRHVPAHTLLVSVQPISLDGLQALQSVAGFLSDLAFSTSPTACSHPGLPAVPQIRPTLS